ncbi:MAG: ABC transporter permease [Opitutales bacterium]
MKKHLDWIIPVCLGIALIGLWYLSLSAGWVSPYLLPQPQEVLQEIPKEWDRFSNAIKQTAYASIVGFLAATGGGFLIALILASNRYVKSALYPYVLILQMTPIIVIIPLISIWIGNGLGSITLITFLIGFFPVVANTTAGLTSTDKNLLNLFKMGNATKAQELLELRIPYAMPHFLTGMKIAGTLSPIGALTGDFLLGDSINGGLGYLLIVFRQAADTTAVFSLGLITCLLGFVFVATVNLIHYFALHKWHDSYNNKDA